MSNKKTTWVCRGHKRTGGLKTEPCSLANDCTFQVSGSYIPVGCTVFGNDSYHVDNWVKQERETGSETSKFKEYLVPPAIDFTDEAVRLNFYKGSCTSLGLPCADINCARCILGVGVPASLRNDYIEARGYPRVLIDDSTEGVLGSGYCKDNVKPEPVVVGEDTSSAVIAAARWFINHKDDFMFSEDEAEFENERGKHIAEIMANVSHAQLSALVLSLMLYSSEFDDCLKHIEEMER